MAEAHRDSERKGVANFKTEHDQELEQLVVTINPATGGIVKLEKIDKAGKHQELSDEDSVKLVGEDEVDDIEAALDEAFDAAVVSVIGEEYESDSDYEDDEEKAIRRFLISDLLIPRAVRRRILHRLLLSRMLHRRLRNKRRMRQ